MLGKVMGKQGSVWWGAGLGRMQKSGRMKWSAQGHPVRVPVLTKSTSL